MARVAPGRERFALVERVDGRPAVMTQTWADTTFVHWRVPPDAVQQMLPPGLRADTWDGSGWVGLVPLEMRDVRPVAAGLRMPGVPSTTSFSEVNVRTYVVGPAGPGILFHSLDATSHLAVVSARGALGLPYHAARIDHQLSGYRRAWTVERSGNVRGRLAVTVGRPLESPSPLDEFLTARFRLYTPLGRRRLLTVPARHEHWMLLGAGIDDPDDLDPGLVTAAGYDLGPRPPDHVVAGSPVHVALGLPAVLPAG